MELVRQKNVATHITFPIIDADGDVVSIAANLDSEIDQWSDGANPNGFADCTNEATEIGTDGIYYLSLTQAEMNNDYIYIQVKTSTSGAKTQHILIRTIVGDPLNIATTSDIPAMRGTDNAATATKLLAYVQLLTRSDVAIETDNATELTEINADGGSGAGNFSSQTDSEEALRDRGDAEWVAWLSSIVVKTVLLGDDVKAIKDKTDNLPADPASETNVDANETKINTIDTVVDAIKAVTDVIPNSGALTDIDTGVNNIEAKLPSKSYLSGSTDADGGIDATEAAVIEGECTDALDAYDPPTKAELDTAETNLTTEIDANETKIDTLTTTVGAAGAGLTNINLPNQTMDIAGNITGNLSGSVGSVTGAVGSVTGNVTGSVGSVAAGGITAASIATDAVDADALAADAIAEINATVDIALSDIKLDHLVAVADADDPVDDSIVAKMAASDGDWSGFNNASDSLEAIRDRGDAAWITGGGGSITDIVQVIPSVPSVIDLANTKTWRLALYLINSLDDLPTAVEITPGTIDIDRSADGGTTWANVVNGAACSELAGIIYYDEVFDTGTGYAEGDSIRVTFKNQKITVAANDYEISGATGMIFYSTVLQGLASLNDISVADILAGTVDVLDLQDTLKRILAWAAGELTVNGNIVTYLEQDDATTEMVQTYTGLQRTVA